MKLEKRNDIRINKMLISVIERFGKTVICYHKYIDGNIEGIGITGAIFTSKSIMKG